jgi:hypothetical protein
MLIGQPVSAEGVLVPGFGDRLAHSVERIELHNPHEVAAE